MDECYDIHIVRSRLFYGCRVLLNVRTKFQPEVIVCQCGADGLAGDPMESLNLTPHALGKCIYTMLSWKLPLLLLGGGRMTFT